LGRDARILAIAGREIVRRAEWPTLLAVGLMYAGVTLSVVLDAFVASFTGTTTGATFEMVIGSPLWPLLVLIVTTSVGAGSIADDVGNRSFTLYRSRPIHLVDYLVAKTIACGSWLVIATVGPGLAAVGIVAALGYGSSTVVLGAAAGFVTVGILVAVFFTGLALALSSLTNRALYAGVTIFGLVLTLYVGASIVAAITGNPYVAYASPVDDLWGVAHATFGLAGAAPVSPATAAGILAGAGIGLWGFALWRLNQVEVISE
jgi:ABC-type transport system involved in multi-copper enzyme maturation permease subunit